ncbi:MAG: DNA repair protein RadC [Lachnospiraceae bacterium]|nr:DNA repair protein RadC [Lachnospiraceae bacterium]
MTNNTIELPYDKYQRLGPSALTDTELLSIILRNGTPKEDAISLSARILSLCDDENRILGLTRLSYEDLLQIDGIGKVKAMCIGCIVELSRRMSMQSRKADLKLNDPKTISDYYMEKFRHLDRETVYLLLVDSKCNLIKEVTLTTGTVNSSLLSSRDMFICALKHKACGIIVIHNHPSGDPSPSKSDIEITAKLKRAGSFMDIPLIDHIIIGDRTYYSFRNQGYI